MSRMGAIILFLFILNLIFAVVQVMGFTTGGVNAYYGVGEMNETYSPEDLNTKITGIALIDETFYGVSLITDSLSFLKNIAYNLTFGVYDFYYTLLSLAGGTGAGIGLLATVLAVIQYMIFLVGLLEFASGRKAGI